MEEKNKIPEVRFKGFGGEWEVTNLETLTKINQGLQIAIKNRYTEKIGGSYFYITNEFLKEGVNVKYYIFNPPETVLCTEHDVLMTRTGNTGEVVTDIAGAFHNNFFKIKFDSEELNKNFFVYFLRLCKTQAIILRLAGVSTIPDLNHSDFYRIEIALPSLKEQTKIGNYFQQLDSLITLHQQKHDKLLNVKKAMLEKMFPKKGADVPEIRFKGFSDKWVERGYSESFTNISNNTLSRSELNYNSGQAKNVHYGDILIKFGELLDIKKEKIPFITNNTLANKFKSSRLQNGDVIIADAAEDEIVGKCTELVNVGEEIIFSGLHTIPIRPTLSFASKYLGYYLNSSSYHNQLLPLMQGTKVLSISKSAIKDTSISFPVDLFEQTKIGNFFKNLDTLLTLHQTELTKLKNIKKSCLEKMFI